MLSSKHGCRPFPLEFVAKEHATGRIIRRESFAHVRREICSAPSSRRSIMLWWGHQRSEPRQSLATNLACECLEPDCCCDTIRPEVFAAREFAKIADSSTLRTRNQSTSRIETSIPTAEELRATDRLPAAQCETALLGPQLNHSWRAGVALGIVMSRLAAVLWVLANLR
jgi:hypothetical protein